MRKQLLLFGASVVTAMGVALMTLSLSLVLAATSAGYAYTEAVSCPGACAKGGGLCASSTCDNSVCGCPDKPNASNKCPCGEK